MRSITLTELIESLTEYQNTHPESNNRQVYFDGLAIAGNVEEKRGILELM